MRVYAYAVVRTANDHLSAILVGVFAGPFTQERYTRVLPVTDDVQAGLQSQDIRVDSSRIKPG